MASCFCTDDLLVCFPMRTDQNEILPLWDSLRNILPKGTGYLYRFWLSAFLTEGNPSHFCIWMSLSLLKKNYHRVIRSKDQRQVPMCKHGGGVHIKSTGVWVDVPLPGVVPTAHADKASHQGGWCEHHFLEHGLLKRASCCRVTLEGFPVKDV